MMTTSWSCAEPCARRDERGVGRGRSARRSASCSSWQAMRSAGAVRGFGGRSRPRGGSRVRTSLRRRGGSPMRRGRQSSRTASATSPVARGCSWRACARGSSSAKLLAAPRVPRLRPGAAGPRRASEARRGQRASPGGAGPAETSGALAPAQGAAAREGAWARAESSVARAPSSPTAMSWTRFSAGETAPVEGVVGARRRAPQPVGGTSVARVRRQFSAEPRRPQARAFTSVPWLGPRSTGALGRPPPPADGGPGGTGRRGSDVGQGGGAGFGTELLLPRAPHEVHGHEAAQQPRYVHFERLARPLGTWSHPWPVARRTSQPSS